MASHNEKVKNEQEAGKSEETKIRNEQSLKSNGGNMINWFDSLDKKVRYAIVIIPWVFYFIFLITDMVALMAVSLIIAIVPSFLAAISHDKKVKVKQAEEKANEEAKRQVQLQEKENIDVEYKISGTTVSIGFGGGNRSSASEREFKGESLVSLIDDYVVADLETTGLSSSSDSIIEISAIRYENDTEISRFHSFVRFDAPLPSFIVEITGITDDMLADAPTIDEVLPQFIDFVGYSVIVAHNANFDINFIYDKALEELDIKFSNNFIDTLRLARKCNLPVENNKLGTLAQYFEIEQSEAHRATADCETTQAIYIKLKEHLRANANEKKTSAKYTTHQSARSITTATDINEEKDADFEGKTFLFTGGMLRISRENAMREVVKRGGIIKDGMSKKIDILVNANPEGVITSKVQRALEMQAEGHPIKIVDEQTFLKMLEDNNAVELVEV